MTVITALTLAYISKLACERASVKLKGQHAMERSRAVFASAFHGSRVRDCWHCVSIERKAALSEPTLSSKTAALF